MAINFYLDKRPDKSGDNPIRVSISLKGKRLVTSVGYSVSSVKWDNDKQIVKKGHINGKGIAYNVINSHLNRITSYFTEFENQAILSEDSQFDLKSIYTLKFGKGSRLQNALDAQETKTLFDRLDEFTTEMGISNQWTHSTYEKFAAIKNHLQRFNDDLTFEYLNIDGLNRFVDYLRVAPLSSRKNVDGDVGSGMRNSTIGKQLGFLKWFLRWATSKGYNAEKAFEAFSPKLKNAEKKVIFLEWEELMAVYQFKIPESKSYLARVRDVFCFCCFSSLRYSDVANLRRSDVFEGYISITTIKTADSLRIELNDYSKAILARYENDVFEKNLALPVISNQRMNEYLKELGELCGIDKAVTVTYYKGNQRYDEVYPKYALLGTHCGRRTFICNALMLGIAPQVVMKWTGHSDYKAMKPYIDVADKAKSEAMNLFNKK